MATDPVSADAMSTTALMSSFCVVGLMIELNVNEWRIERMTSLGSYSKLAMLGRDP